MEEVEKKIIELNEKIDNLQQHILDIEDMLVDVFGISEFISRTLTTNRYTRKFNKIVDKKAEAIEKPIIELPKVPIIIKYQSENVLEINEVDYELYLNDKYKWIFTLKLQSSAIKTIEDYSFNLLFNVYGYENGEEKLAFTRDSIEFCIHNTELENGKDIYKSGYVCTCEPGEKTRIEIVDDINPKENKEDDTKIIDEDVKIEENYYDLPAYARIDKEKENEVVVEDQNIYEEPRYTRLKKMAREWNN